MIKEQLPSLAGATPEELAHAIFDVLDAKKAQNIKVLRVNDQTVITDYFVICTGNSSTQVKSLAGEVEYKLGLREVDPLHFEGRDNNGWIVLDYSSVIVHIFNRENRDFYQLEKLYGDAEPIAFVGIDDKIGEEQ
ncbi:MAG: ribosome silencing factor [Clostridia bacterium]|nr:ribosome silencing factor [Clostridia bacterium]